MCPHCGGLAWSRHGGACPRHPWRIIAGVLGNPKVLHSVFLSTAVGVVSFTVAFICLH